MSELLIVEDDPEPSPTSSAIQHAINFETGLSYEGPVASETLLAEREVATYEREAMTRLLGSANAILREYDVEGESDDVRVASGDMMLRRRVLVHTEEDRIIQTNAYFYVDKTNGENYCRSWSDHSSRVNWCFYEQRHEPADDVRVRLEAAFPLISVDEIPARKFGGRVLAKLLRRD